MHRRIGHTYRILDGERFTFAFCGNYIADGGHRRPVIDVIDRRHPNNSIVGHAPKQLFRIPLPLIRFRRCYRFRKVGGLVLYRRYSRLMRIVAGR